MQLALCSLLSGRPCHARSASPAPRDTFPADWAPRRRGKAGAVPDRPSPRHAVVADPRAAEPQPPPGASRVLSELLLVVRDALMSFSLSLTVVSHAGRRVKFLDDEATKNFFIILSRSGGRSRFRFSLRQRDLLLLLLSMSAPLGGQQKTS